MGAGLALAGTLGVCDVEHHWLVPGLDMATFVRVLSDGRLRLPLGLRRRHGLAKGGDVVLEGDDDGIAIRTFAQSVERAQRLSRALLAGRPASVDDFLAEKRREAASA